MRLMPNITKRRNTYYFQRRVPDDLRHIWDKKFIRTSLGTTDQREANRKAAPLIAEWDEKFAAARDGTLRMHTDEFLEGHVFVWFHEFRQSVNFHRFLEGAREFDGAEPPEPRPGEPIAPLANKDQLRHSIREYLERNELDITGTDLDWLVDRAQEEHYFGFWEPERLEPGGPRAMISSSKGPGFLETFEAYLIERRIRDKTAGEFRTYVLEFLSLDGGEMPIRDIAKHHLVEYKNLLLRRPKRLTPKQRKLDLRKLILSLGDQDVETISAATVNKHLVPIHAVLNYAVDNGLIESNPAQGVKATRTKATVRKRLPYTVDDLNKIIASLDRSDKHPERYWLPLLGLFTGARLEELAQLYVSDVHGQDGIHCFNIAEIEEGQSVKNLASIRQVPLHPRLIKLGFLDFVNQRKKAKAEMLFNLKPYRGVYSHGFSKWYGRHVRGKVGVTDPRKVFHSLRHNFKDAGRNAEIDKALVDALQGHTDGSVSASYGSGYSLKALDRAMKQVRYPGLALGLKSC